MSCATLKSIKAFDSSFNHSLLALICAQALGYRFPLNGIPGVNFYDQGFWANLYKNSSNNHRKGSQPNINMPRFKKYDVENEVGDAAQVKQFGDQYCKNAIYKKY